MGKKLTVFWWEQGDGRECWEVVADKGAFYFLGKMKRGNSLLNRWIFLPACGNFSLGKVSRDKT